MNSFIRFQSEIFVLCYIQEQTALKIFWLEKALWQIMSKKINYLDVKIQTKTKVYKRQSDLLVFVRRA